MASNLEKTTEKIIDLADSVCRTLGYILVDARLAQQGRTRSVEVTIHRQNGQIGFEDCELVSRNLDTQLEESQPPIIEGNYLLEVQSPGLDRKLTTEREFDVFAGYPVEVKARQKLDSLGDSFRGTLIGLKNGVVSFGNLKRIAPKGKSAKAKSKVTEEPLPKKLEIELNKLLNVRLYSEVES